MSQESPEVREEQTFREALDLLNRADVAGFIGRVAPDVDWKAVEELHRFEDREAVRRYTTEWLDHWSDFSLDVEELRRLTRDWLVIVRARGHSRAGVEIDDRFYLRVAVRDGQIVRWHEFSNEPEALEAAGLSE